MYYGNIPPIPVALRSEPSVCSRRIAVISGSNPAECMDIHLLCWLCCVGSGMCDGLITRTQESYRLCVYVCDLVTSAVRSELVHTHIRNEKGKFLNYTVLPKFAKTAWCWWTFDYFYNSINPFMICYLYVNPLQPKRRPLYLKTQSVPRCKHFSSRL